ncbi:histone H4 transcription factor-like [Clytia hemisphaerica]|uniref:C2H2-type domain-containing protein n=1 Tax=Clytia hemisphaerica TaxID=252671 RepID=A0A7M5WKZ3_9CNID
MPKQKKRSPKICMVACEWENCQWRLDIEPTEYEIFSDHLKAHADAFVAKMREDADWSEDKAMACCCMWRGCSWEGCGEWTELLRHVMYHGYHVLLKALGKIVQEKLQLATCRIEMEDPYNMLINATPLLCQWSGCNTEFFCPNKFYRHVDKHGLETHPLPDEKTDLKFECSWEACNDRFRNKYKLKEHVRVHTHEKLIACPDCGGMFANRTKLKDHLSRQDPEGYENFQCSHCLKRCASERLLRDHMRHHVNYLKCPHCEMTCPNPGSLKYHIGYRHTDIRPFSCAMCEQSFKSHSDLVRHEESHLEKSYICDVKDCFYSTKTQHCLRRHIRVVHSSTEKRYICHICNTAYSRGFGLTKHLKKKHNFSWPSGHPRFRYIQYEDGFYRLQMVRFESVELTKRLHGNIEENNGISEPENDGDNNEEDGEITGAVYDGVNELDNENTINIVLIDSSENYEQTDLQGIEQQINIVEEQAENVELDTSNVEINTTNVEDEPEDIEENPEHMEVPESLKDQVESVDEDENFVEKLEETEEDVLYTNVAYQDKSGGEENDSEDIEEEIITCSDDIIETSTTLTANPTTPSSNTVDALRSSANILPSAIPCEIILKPKPKGYEKTVMAQLLDIGKKQNHQELASLVDSAIVTDLYQRLKAGMSREKHQQKVVYAGDITTSELEEGGQGAQEGGPPEVGANEVLVTEEVTVESKRPLEDGSENKRPLEDGSENKRPLEDGSESEEEEERNCKRIKCEEDSAEIDLNEIIEHVSKDISNDVTLSNEIRNKMVASVLLSLNGETQTT